MDFDYVVNFDDKLPPVRDWEEYHHEVYDFLKTIIDIMEDYRKYIIDYISINKTLTSDEVKLAYKNLHRVTNMITYFPISEVDIANEISLYMENVTKSQGFNYSTNTFENYIKFLDLAIEKVKKALAVYDIKKEEFFVKDLTKLAKLNLLDPKEIINEWEQEKKKLLEQNGKITSWSDTYNDFFFNVFKTHADEIAKNKEKEEYHQVLTEHVKEVVEDIKTRLK